MSHPGNPSSFLPIYPGTAPCSHTKNQGENKNLGNILRSQMITVRTSGLTSYRGGAAFIDSFACECVWLKTKTHDFRRSVIRIAAQINRSPSGPNEA